MKGLLKSHYLTRIWLSRSKAWILGLMISAIFIMGLNSLRINSGLSSLLLSYVILLLSWNIARSILAEEDTKSTNCSYILTVYYILSIIIFAIQLRTASLLHSSRPLDAYLSIIIFNSVFLILLISLLVLENLRKSPGGYIILEEDDSYDKCEEDCANFFSVITFSWMNSTMKRGYLKPLNQDDLGEIRKSDRCSESSKIFAKNWSFELSKNHPSLGKALFKSFGTTYVFAALFKLVQDLLQFTQPQLLNFVIKFIQKFSSMDQNEEDWSKKELGFFLAFSMLLTANIQSIMIHQYFHRCMRTGMRIRAALTSAIYQKALNLSSSARQQRTTGEIVNLMSVDTQRIMDLMPYFHIIWSGPLQICLAMVSLYQLMGVSIFAGVAVLIIMIPINSLLAVKSRKYQRMQMKNKDERMKLMDEILNGIKVIKLYAWELPFLKRVHTVREKELDTMRSIGLLGCVQSFTYLGAPFFVAFSTFAVYSLISTEPLTTNKVFVSIALFNLLTFPLSMFPQVISGVIEASVALSRIYKYLRSENLDSDAVVKYPPKKFVEPLVDIEGQDTIPSDESYSLVLSNGSFSWEKDESKEPTLKNIEVKLKPGEVLAIVGRVGSGKSSIISAMLGEMYRTPGTPPVSIYGKVAYSGQQAWIMNATLRENILFGHAYDEIFYQETLEACALIPDLKSLPAGDQTEIGEKGINLSGGQKQRISIARAVYSQADIYLFDDPLSAVDSHVGKHIFEKVLGPNGILKKKAKLLVTHAIQYLPYVDNILMLNKGEIIEGPIRFQDVLRKGPKSLLFKLLKEFLSESMENVEINDEEDIMKSMDKISSNKSPEKNLEKNAEKRKPSETLLKREGTLIEIERMERGSVKSNVFLKYVKSCSLKASIFGIFVLLISQCFQIGSNIWLKNWGSKNDRLENGDLEDGSLALFLSGYALLGLSYTFFVVLLNFIVNIPIAIGSARKLHRELLDGVISAKMSFFDTTPLGRIINRFSKDVYTIDEILPRVFYSFFRTLVSVTATILVITTVTPLFIVMMFPIAYIYLYVRKYYISTSRELKRLESTSRSPIYAQFSETLGGVSTIRAFDQVERFLRENERRIDQNQRAYYPSVSSNRWLAMRLELVGSLVIFGSALFAVIGTVIFGNIDAGLAGLSISYALTITQSLNWTVRQSCEIETNIVSVERVLEYMGLASEGGEERDFIQPVPSWPQYGEIVFRNVSLHYREGLPPALKDLNFNIKPSEKIGIIGRTGSGKSSIMAALFRLVEPDGSILIDGVDVKNIGLDDLRKKVTIIPQDPVLFGGTLRENLDPFNEVSDQELWYSLESTHLKDLVSELDGKLDATVLQGGENFSVGQRQLICMARALIRKSKILVMDEATAAIDVQTDAVIQETIRREFSQCTVLTIAHRINTVIDCDRLLVLDKGQVVEIDSPEKVLSVERNYFD